MTKITVSELEQDVASYVRRAVADGETFEITEDGLPSAILSPANRFTSHDPIQADGDFEPDDGANASAGLSPLDRLRAAGEVEKPVGDIRDVPEPLKPVPGQPLLSEMIIWMRDNERY